MTKRKIGKHPALAAPYGGCVTGRVSGTLLSGWQRSALEAARRDYDAVELAALEAPLSAAGLRSSWYLDHAETLLQIAEITKASVSIPDRAPDAARD